MKRFLKGIFPVLLAAVILFSIGWYLLEYDPDFTTEILLQQARNLEENGNEDAAIFLYNFAYDYFGGSDEIALELAEHFKQYGNYSKAEATLRDAIADGGSVELYIALSQTYVEQGKLRDAVLMLDNLSEDMKAQLAPYRPQTPAASLEPGSYKHYLPVDIITNAKALYVTTDRDYPSSITDAYTGPIVLGLGETVIFAVSVGENGLVSPLTVFQYVVSDVVEEITFQDTGFDQAIRQQLSLGTSQLIYSDLLWTVTELTLPAEVASITDLKWFPNLESLTIEGATVDDPQALSALSALTSLSVTGAAVDADTLAAIGTLTNLQTLTLSNCSISSIERIAGLTKLTRLDLSGNAIRNISALMGMTELTYLDLGSNALIDLDGLNSLLKLEYLDVSYNSLVTTGPLSGMTALEDLNISSNALRELAGIDTLTNLQTLTATHNQLVDIEALAQCSLLQSLDVSHNTLLSIDVAATLTNLETLNFGFNEVSVLPTFSSDCGLRIINGEHNLLSSLKSLSGLQNLTHVYMDYNQDISSVSTLTKCPNLQEVYVYGTKVTTVSELTNLGVLVVYSPAT